MELNINQEPELEFDRARSTRRAISLIPLVDIALFLLIFFMVAGTLDTIEIIDVSPPAAESGALVDEGQLVILLGRHEEIVVDDRLVSMEELSSSVSEILKQNPNKIITVKADAAIPANRLIRVMDRLRQAGGKHLSVMTESGSPAKQAGGR